MALNNEKGNESFKSKTKIALKPGTQLVVWALVLSLIVVFGIMFYNMVRGYHNAQNDVLELSKNSSIQNASEIDTFLTRHSDVILSTAEAFDYLLTKENVSHGEIREFLNQISVIYNDELYEEYVGKKFSGMFAAVDGTLIHGLRAPEELVEGYDPYQRQWYIECKAGEGKVVFGEPYIDIYDSSQIDITVSKLLSDGVSAIGMDITMDDLQTLVQDLDISISVNGVDYSYGYGFVITENGIVMGHSSDNSQQGMDYSDPDSPMHEIYLHLVTCEKEGASVHTASFGGIEYGFFSQKLSNGWYAVTLTELSSIKTVVSDFSSFLLTGTIIIVLIVSVYCFLILRAYVRSEKLTENLQDVLEMAKTDALTGLGNRAAFDMYVRQLDDSFKTDRDKSFALVMMDLNDLKYINDRFGHSEGDQYIKNSCDLIKGVFGGELYRIGGDEFALFLLGDKFERRNELCDKLRHQVEEANSSLTPRVESPSIAVGMAVHHVGGDDGMDNLQRKADAEMYTHKVSIKQNRLDSSEKGFTDDLKLKLMERQSLSAEMQKGLDEEQFEVWFQPQVNYENNGSLIGAEALVRWRHPEKGLVPPGVFIPLFEYSGLIYDLDKYVWRHTCACIRDWIDSGVSIVPISMNVSRYDIVQPGFVDTIVSIIGEYQISYDLIHLEVTESAFADETGKVAEVVKELISRGFIIAIDDFGSGYSSLSLLKDIPAHIVKLDMRFFADFENVSRNECIIESIIRMVKMLGMAVFAEGVEYPQQADRLYKMGCAYIQGYLYSKPLCYDDYVKYMKASISERVDRPNNEPRLFTGGEASNSQQLFLNIISGTNDAIIVADRKTKQLLYANRAAEQYFGKRFDPLHPTTCMRYCERDNLCKSCPSNDLKRGERKEMIVDERGLHIKSLYTQMDWNGRDAFVLYQSDVSIEMHKVEFANSIMDNLGVGVVILSGETEDELKPVFCNKEYMNLSGFTMEEFKAKVTKENLYCIHPDDIANVRDRFAKSLEVGKTMLCYVRVLKKNGKYEWVSMHARVKKPKPTGVDVYMIFRDAQEEVENRRADTYRYQRYIVEPQKKANEALSVLHFNLTRDTCESVYRNILIDRPVVFEKGIQDFVDSVADNIAEEEIRAEFVQLLNRPSLMCRFESGVYFATMDVPIRLADKRIIWCRQSAGISRNPDTGDVEAVSMLSEADRNIRLNFFYQSIIRGDYECVGSIDTQTGFVTIVDESVSHGLPDIYGKAVRYMDNIAERVKGLVEEDSVQSCIEAMSFETVLKELEKPGDYICSFPSKHLLDGRSADFRWRFGYVKGDKSEILFTRKAIVR